MPWEVKEHDGKQCVFKKGASSPINGGCHDDRNSALKQMKALYAGETGGMNKYAVIDIGKAFSDEATDDENTRWVQAWRYSTWDHPKYGEVVITPELGKRFKEHFDSRTYGQDLHVNFAHGLDPAKGKAAAGWVRDIAPREDGIYYLVAFTEDAMSEIKAGKWRYLSPEYNDYEDPETGTVHEDVPMGLALDNRPFFKNMAPLNFSEHFSEEAVIDVPDGTWFSKEEITSDGGDRMNEELFKKFCEALGIELPDEFKFDDEQLILAEARKFSDIVEPLRKAKEQSEARKTFAEAYPEEYKELQAGRIARIEGDAKIFAEGYSRFFEGEGEEKKDTGKGYSRVVLEQIEDTHKKFSAGEGTIVDLKELLDIVSSPDAVVDFVERGSGRESERDHLGVIGSGDARKDFAAAVVDVMEKDELDYSAAVDQAAKLHPKMFAEYVGDRRPIS